MISKVITGKTFYGACRYICQDKTRAIILETEGVRAHDYKLMAKDFEMQQQLRPTLSKAVFHGILSFYPGEKLEDKKMVEIAKEYLKELKIENTQYAITKHTDRNHLHLHILANLVNNNGEAIKDSWIGLKGKKIAQQLTSKYELKQALGKNLDLTNLERLNEKEANRYVIYQAIQERLPQSKNLNDLKQQLEKQAIETLYKYKGQTQELQGISFKIGEYKYKGSEIDRNFSLNNLQRIINQQHLKLEHENRIQFLSKHFENTLQKTHDEPNKELQKEKSLILEQLMKPEQRIEQAPSLLIKKKRKQKRLYRKL